jgi:hypothetical protein
MLNSSSSLSRCPDIISATPAIAGIAMADSLESLNDQVPYRIPLPNAVFWVSTTTTSGFTGGQTLDLGFSAASRYYALDSANTAVARVDPDGASGLVVDSNSGIPRVRIILDQDALLYNV